MSKLVIGLTGGIGSGKTTITDIFQTLGVDIIDADIIARQVVAINSPALSAIAQHFGAEFIEEDGQLNRSLLRNRIFSSEADKLWLNNLLHPLIRENIIAQTKAASSDYCILVAPLLIENNLNLLVDKVLVVDVSEQTQIERTLLRDSSSAEVIKSIMDSQISRTERLEAADDIINNETPTNNKEILSNKTDQRTDIEKQVRDLNQKYLALTKMV
ncbi:dephospho-CoA kinase [Colwellia sp. E2M01]|uniref:dephospho-CoA kinase n=1 Tax=Colwellia sp. E2M01 TaxID=2841561 RepID=UPI001C09A38A|nr:dephospho-CoA kinase [Colwellia sp. E2M01]MBU2870206.1 dephospho-CoA kinase [Colwellia sp. E2M01]